MKEAILTKKDGYTVTKRKVSDYQPDPQNANRGNRRGKKVLENSYRRAGAGRSWLADKDGQLIAGNHAREAAIAAGVEDVIEVVVDDPTLQVVVRRPDLDLDNPETPARELAFADNRTSEVGLEWSPDEVREFENLLRDAELFRDDELEALLVQGEVEEGVSRSLDPVVHNNRESLDGRQAKISPVLYMDDLAAFEEAILMARKLTGKRRRGDCLRVICEFFLDQHVDSDIQDLLESESKSYDG